jgi:hydrogenase maturation protease
MTAAIIAVGGELREDDGIAILAARKLSNIFKDTYRFDIIDEGLLGFNIFYYLDRYEKIVILDAVYFGGQVGEVKLFSINDLESFNEPIISSHRFGIADILRIVKFYEIKSEIHIIGIQPFSVRCKMGLSKKLELKFQNILLDTSRIINNIIT